MKAICASLILALLVTSTMSLGTCDNTNKGFPKYAEANTTGTAATTAVAVAAGAGTICTELLAADGTCCVAASLNTLFSTKMTPIKTAWDAFIAGAVAVNGEPVVEPATTTPSGPEQICACAVAAKPSKPKSMGNNFFTIANLIVVKLNSFILLVKNNKIYKTRKPIISQ